MSHHAAPGCRQRPGGVGRIGELPRSGETSIVLPHGGAKYRHLALQAETVKHIQNKVTLTSASTDESKRFDFGFNEPGCLFAVSFIELVGPSLQLTREMELSSQQQSRLNEVIRAITQVWLPYSLWSHTPIIILVGVTLSSCPFADHYILRSHWFAVQQRLSGGSFASGPYVH